ncbi:3785_t:CDS:2, partial [Cetraspora pellucida]
LNYSVIEGTDNVEFDENEEMNQLISICGPDTYQASIHTSITQKQEYAYGFGVAKSGLKFALENKLVDEFVKLIERFIGNYTGVDVNNQMTIDVTCIENPKRLKHKGRSKMQKSSENQDKSRRMVETDTEDEEFEESSREQDSENYTPKSETHHCGNCYGTGHYATTCKFPKDHF